MQAVILAAGQSNRFYPFSNLAHKSLVKIMGRTLLEHTLLSIKKSGIKDIIIVISSNSTIKDILGDGKDLGLQITYITQSEPLGMGDALLKAEQYIHGDFFLTNANHIDFHEFAPAMMKKKRKKDAIVLLGRKEKSTGVYGSMQVDGEKVTGFIEKPPEIMQSSLRHIGIYLFTKKFLEVLAKTPLEHYHLEHAIDAYAREGSVTYIETEKKTVTLKYAIDLLGIKNYLLKNVRKHISKKADVSKHALIIGTVYIEDGAKVFENSCIKGPCYIGKNAVVGNNALLRDGVSLEESAVAGSYMEMKNTLVMNGSHTHSGFIGDSIIGKNCRIGGGFASANQRIDRDTVKFMVNEKSIDSARKFLGVLIGDNVKTGANVTTMPGVIIGNNSLIGPSTVVMKNIEENVTFYTKFEEVVKKQK